MDDDVSPNQTILFSLGIIAITLIMFLVTKCTIEVHDEPDLKQALQACAMTVTYKVVKSGETDKYYEAPASPELLATIEKCHNRVTEVYLNQNRPQYIGETK